MGKGGLPRRRGVAKGRPLRSDSLPRGMPTVALGKSSRSAKLKGLAKKVKKPLKSAVRSKVKPPTPDNDAASVRGRKNAGLDNESTSSRSPNEPSENKTNTRQRMKGVSDRSESPSTTRLSRSSSSSSIAPKPGGPQKATNIKTSGPVKNKPKPNAASARGGLLKFFTVEKETESLKGLGKKHPNQPIKKDKEPLSVQIAGSGSKRDGSATSSSLDGPDQISSQCKSGAPSGASGSAQIGRTAAENNHDEDGEEEVDDDHDERLSLCGPLSEDLFEDGNADQSILEDSSSKVGAKSGDCISSVGDTAPKVTELTKKNINQLFPVEEIGGKRLRSGSPASQKSTRSLSLQKAPSKIVGGSSSRYATRSDSAIRVLRNGKRSKIKSASMFEGLVSENVKRKKGPPGLLKFDEDKMEDSRSDFSDEQSSIFSESDSSSFVDTPTRLKNCELEGKIDSEEAQGSISNDEEDLPIERVDSPVPTCAKTTSESTLEDELIEELTEQPDIGQVNCSDPPTSVEISPSVDNYESNKIATSSCDSTTVNSAQLIETLNLESQVDGGQPSNILSDIHTDWDTDAEDNKDDSCALSKGGLSSIDELMLEETSAGEKEISTANTLTLQQCSSEEDSKLDESLEKCASPEPGPDGYTKLSSPVPSSDFSNGQKKLPDPIVIKTSNKNGFAESVDFVAKKNPRIDFELLRKRTKRSMSINLDGPEKANQSHRILAVESPKVNDVSQIIWTVKAVREPIIPKVKKAVDAGSPRPASPSTKVATDLPVSSRSSSDLESSDSQSSSSSSSLKENMNIQPSSKQCSEVGLSREPPLNVSRSTSLLSPSTDSSADQEKTLLPSKQAGVPSESTTAMLPTKATSLEGNPPSILKVVPFGSPKTSSAGKSFLAVSCSDSFLATAAKTPIKDNCSNINQEPFVPSPVSDQNTETDAAAEERCVTPLNHQPIIKIVEKTPERSNMDDGESFCLRLSPTPTKDDGFQSDQSIVCVDVLPSSEKEEELLETSKIPLGESCDNSDCGKPVTLSEDICHSQTETTTDATDDENENLSFPKEISENANESVEKISDILEDKDEETREDKLSSPSLQDTSVCVEPIKEDQSVSYPAEDGDLTESSKETDQISTPACEENGGKLVTVSEESVKSDISPQTNTVIVTEEEMEVEESIIPLDDLATSELISAERSLKSVSSIDVERGRATAISGSRVQRSRSLGSFDPPLSLVINLKECKANDKPIEANGSGGVNHSVNVGAENGLSSEKLNVEGDNSCDKVVGEIAPNQLPSNERSSGETGVKKRRSSEGSLVFSSRKAEDSNQLLTMTVECTETFVKQPGLLSPRLEADVERHHLQLNKSNIERKRREITEEEQSPEKKAIKECMLKSLGLQSVAAAAAAVSDPSRPGKRRSQDGLAPSSGRLKTVIKVPKDSKKDKKGERKPLRMVFKNGKPSLGGFDDMPTLNHGVEGDSVLRIEANSSHDTSLAAGGFGSGSSSALLVTDSSAQVPGSEADGKSKPDANLVIPEKSSSFSIHPGRLCSDVCSYCFGKFGSLDTPCHVAQLKSRERQMKIMSVETHLAMDSCLCDACIRYVDRKANCPSAKSQPSQKKNKRKYEGSMSTCSVTGCGQPAAHPLRKKWYIKIRKSVQKKCPIDLDLAHQHLPLPLCSEHYSYMEYFMVCALCKKPLSRSHMYSLSNTREINMCLEADGIPARLSDKLFVCKLCKYYATLRVKHPRGNFTLSANQREFFNSYRKRILKNHDIEVSESGESAGDGNTAEQAAPDDTTTASSEENLTRGKRKRSKSNATSPGEAEEGEPSRKKSRSSDHKSKEKDKERLSGSYRESSREPDGANPTPHVPGALVTTLPVLHSKSSKNSKASKVKTVAEVDPVAAAEWVRKGFPPFYPGEDDLALHAKFQFQYEDSPSDTRAWEKCTSLLQFDRETKKLWQELQRPYGSQSSFLRHLVLMERYWRQGELVLSPTASARATSYTMSVQNRLKAYGSTFTAKTSPESPKTTQSTPVTTTVAASVPTAVPSIEPIVLSVSSADVTKALSGGTVLTAAAAAAAVTAVHTHPGPPSASPSAQPAQLGKQQGKAPAKAQAPPKASVQVAPPAIAKVTPQKHTVAQGKGKLLKLSTPSQENATLKHQLSQPALKPLPVLPTSSPLSISPIPKSSTVQRNPQTLQLKPIASLCKTPTGQTKVQPKSLVAKPLTSSRVSASTWEPTPLSTSAASRPPSDKPVPSGRVMTCTWEPTVHPAVSRPQYSSAPVVNLTRSISLTAVPSSPPAVPDLHPISSDARPSRPPSNSTCISVTSTRGSPSGGFVSILPASTTLMTFPKLSSQSLSKPASITPIYTSQTLPSSVSVTSSVSSVATVCSVGIGEDAKPATSAGRVHVTAGGKSFALTIQQFKKLQALRQQRQLDQQRKKGLAPKQNSGSKDPTIAVSHLPLKMRKDDLEVVEVRDRDSEVHQNFVPTISAVCSGDQVKAMWDEGSRSIESEGVRAPSPPMVEITPIVETSTSVSVENLPKIPKALTVTQIRGDTPSKVPTMTSSGMSVTITRQACQTPVPIQMTSPALDIFPS